MSPLTKTVILFVVILVVVGGSFAVVVLHHEDGGNRVTFSLTNQHGERTNQQDLSGESLLVFFGFTSCRDVCPTQMSKLSNVMNALEKTGHGQRVTPVFISVDPERDTVDKMADYLDYFHEDFVGLTGSRGALQSAADTFRTLLDQMPEEARPGYQIAHSSIVYVVDPFSRIVDFIPFAEPIEDMTKRIRKQI